jgi:uncharacterized protein YprB with RNaseH-like and TPR domain
MLRNTFCHVPGFGVGTERRLWTAGVRSWDEVTASAALPLGPAKRELLRQAVEQSAAALAARDSAHFAARLPTAEHWRMYREFGDAAAYLDIETTGLSGAVDQVTTIVVYDGTAIRHYVHGQNLEDFARDIRDYRLLVTYNGKTFDLPFLRQALGVHLDQAHIDLRHVLASLGYRGGLKNCERQLGFDRGELADVDGFFAVLLWQDYQRGNPRALDTLLAYNTLDVLNLARLMPQAYNLKLRDTPFLPSHRLASPAVPANPFRADPATIHRLQRARGWW